jgi:hypothetical protein
VSCLRECHDAVQRLCWDDRSGMLDSSAHCSNETFESHGGDDDVICPTEVDALLSMVSPIAV